MQGQRSKEPEAKRFELRRKKALQHRIFHRCGPDRGRNLSDRCTRGRRGSFLRQAPIGQLTAVIAVAKKMGAQIIPDSEGLLVKRAGRLISPLLLETDVYPGYPTDLQSPMLTALCCAEGNCMVSERVFNGRFGVHEQLNRMGAAIVAGQTSAEVTGGRKLHGERVLQRTAGRGGTRAGGAVVQSIRRSWKTVILSGGRI